MARTLPLFLCTLLLCASLPGGRASAQRRSGLLEQGVALREEGRDADALALFERAYEESHSGQALAQIALAEQALGRLVEAEAHLAEALARTEDAFVRRNRVPLASALTEIRAGLGDLQVTGGVDGAEVLLAGQPIGVLPLDAPLRVVAGEVSVEVRASGHRPFRLSVAVPGGGAATIEVVLERVPSETGSTPVVITPDEGDHDTSASWAMPVGIALLGAGAVGIGVGAGLMVVREDNAQLRQRCSDVDPGCRSAYQSAVDAEGGGIASFVLGGAFLAGGAAVLALDAMGVLASSGDASTASVTCAPGPLSFACVGRF